MEPVPRSIRQVIGPFRDRNSASSRRSARAGPGHHGQRVLVGLARAGARDGRARPRAIHHADGPGCRGRYAVVASSARTSRRSRTARARARQHRPRGLLWRGLASGPTGCRSSTARSRRSSAPSWRRSPRATYDLFIGRVDSPRPGTARASAPAVLPAALPADRSRVAESVVRRQAGGLGCRPPRQWASSIGYDVSGGGPPLIRLHGGEIARRGGLRAQLRSSLGVPRHLPEPAGTADARGTPRGLPLRLAGRRPRGRSSTASESIRSTCSGFSMGAMTALQSARAIQSGWSDAGRGRDNDVAGGRGAWGRHDGPNADSSSASRRRTRRSRGGQRRRPGVGRLAAGSCRDRGRTSQRSRSWRGRGSTRSMHWRWSCAATATRSCRREHAARLAPQLPHGRLFVAADCGPRGDGAAAGPVQRGSISGFYRSTEAEPRRSRSATSGRPPLRPPPTHTEGGPR